MRRIFWVVSHNWPLKLAAIGLATLMYGGLVLSQSTLTVPGPIPVDVENQPDNTFLVTAIKDVREVRYFAPSGVRAIASTFKATVDLSGVVPGGGLQTVPIVVTAADDRVKVLGSDPDVAVIQLDELATKDVPVNVVHGTVPAGLAIGQTVVDPARVSVSGPSSVVSRVVAVQASVVIQSTGISVDQDVTLIPVDNLGNAVSPINVAPTSVNVQIPVFQDLRSRSLPVAAVISGTPAPGFEVASVVVTPPAITVGGDADQLGQLTSIDTLPVSVSGISGDLTAQPGLDLPDGIILVGDQTVSVEVKVRPVTATRTFDAGLRLIGARSDRTYRLGVDRVLVTIGGFTADLDRLQGSVLVMDLVVGDLEAGTTPVPVTATLATGLTVVSVSPERIPVTVTAPASASPSASASGSASPSVSPSPSG